MAGYGVLLAAFQLLFGAIVSAAPVGWNSTVCQNPIIRKEW
jgi:hypothetical protein